MVKKYSLMYNGTNNITEHFKVKEFASFKGKIVYSDDVLIDTLITSILEKLFEYLNAYKIVITSGYRTNAHELSLPGGVKNGYHTKGMAVDINVWKNKTERYTSKEICLALEDLGWNHGIGIISNTAVHIDSRSNKYWFDERNHCKSIGDSFYTFYGVKKENPVHEAIDKLSRKGIIDSAAFWKENYNKEVILQYIDDLLIKFASNI